MYIQLVEGEFECQTLRLNDEIALNIGPGELLVGIEIPDAKEVLGKGQGEGRTSNASPAQVAEREAGARSAAEAAHAVTRTRSERRACATGGSQNAQLARDLHPPVF